MSGMAMPAHLAQAQQQEAAINGLRIQIASSVMGHLMEIQYARALIAAREQADPLGLKEPGEQGAVSFQVQLDQPAGLAVAAADALLIRLGLVRAR